MKKLIALLMVTVLICSAFTACAPKDPEENTTIDPMENTAAADVKPKLPEYVPGSIKLQPQNMDDFATNRKYRAMYYPIYSCFEKMIEDEEAREKEMKWFRQYWEEHDNSESIEEMSLVTFIKRNNIPRERFDQAVKEWIAECEEYNWDTTHEYNEVPNADIIYTFDNEIINRYYRYE